MSEPRTLQKPDVLSACILFSGLLVMTAFVALVGLGISRSAFAAEPNAKTERAWRANCASCHGKDGKGATEQGKKMKTGDMTSADWQKKYKDEDMKKAISEGFKREEDGVTKEMKSFKAKLKPEEIDSLLAYVRGFAKAQ